MIKRSKFLLCALASVGIMTSFNTINANAMTSTTTTQAKQTLSPYQVEDLMWKLPYCINVKSLVGQIKDGLQIKYVSDAYNSLTEDQQRRVDPCAVSNLNHAKEVLKRVEKDETKAICLAYGTYRLHDLVGYDTNTRSINNIEKLKAHKNDIREAIEVMEKMYSSLDYSIRDLNGLGDCMNTLSAIEFKLVELGLVN